MPTCEILKPRLSIDEQIEHMKNQGIKFTIINEEEAKSYLENNTYYFKIKAYAKLYEKYKNPEKQNIYINLEFAYLKELSIIDTILRKEIIKIALDIEHYLKTSLIRDFNKTDSDGYKIVYDFIKLNEDHWKKVFKQNSSGKACSNLIEKYKDNFAVWNIVEIMGLQEFQEFYSFFYSTYGQEIYGKNCGPYQYFINPIRILRNAAAHNNCLINSLRIPYVSEEKFNNNPEVSAFLGRNGIKNKSINTNMEKPFLHDFCVLLYLYNEVAPNKAKKYMFKDLKELFENRIAKNDCYFESNATILAAYKFIKNVIDMFYQLNK